MIAAGWGYLYLTLKTCTITHAGPVVGVTLTTDLSTARPPCFRESHYFHLQLSEYRATPAAPKAK